MVNFFDEEQEEDKEELESLGLQKLDELIQKKTEIENEIVKLESELEIKNNILLFIIEKQIPDLMDELNMSEIKLKSGQKLTISEKIFAGPIKEKKQEAYQWLEENELGDVLKEKSRNNFTS